MRLIEAKTILKKHCHYHEEWHCGPATIYVSGRSENPRFDCRLEIFLDLKPNMVAIKKISALLNLLDHLGKPIKFNFSKRSTKKRSALHQSPLVRDQIGQIFDESSRRVLT